MNTQAELQAERSRTREAEAALKVAVEENLELLDEIWKLKEVLANA